MKQQLAIHGRDHRLGGADPVPFELPYCYAKNGAVSQEVTDDAEVLFNSSKTNDRRTFRWDPDDAYGILVMRRGLYRVFSYVCYDVADQGVARSMYAAAQPLASGALAGVGTEFGQGLFALGQGQGDNGDGVVVSDSKSVLQHVAIGELGSADAPWRVVIIAQHDGTDYTIGGTLDSALFVERVGDLGDDTPAPTDMTP